MNSVPLFIHVSTDEVYGEVLEGEASEEEKLNPSNPYSASKASAEMIVGSYQASFGMPIVTVRANNIFGIRQFPEKIIPKFTMQLLSGQPVTLHGDGSNVRRYLAAEDFAEALCLLIAKGQVGAVYNIGAEEEYSNTEIARMLCGLLDRSEDDFITFVADRPFNDRRYSINTAKIEALGWQPRRPLAAGLSAIVEWYRENYGRYRHLFQSNDA